MCRVSLSEQRGSFGKAMDTKKAEACNCEQRGRHSGSPQTANPLLASQAHSSLLPRYTLPANTLSMQLQGKVMKVGIVLLGGAPNAVRTAWLLGDTLLGKRVVFVWVCPLALGTSVDVLTWDCEWPGQAKGHFQDDDLGANYFVLLTIHLSSISLPHPMIGSMMKTR